MKNEEPTTSELKALRFYLSYLEKHGKEPTCRAISRQFGSENSNVGWHYLKQLTLKGYLEERPVRVLKRTVSAKGKARAAKANWEESVPATSSAHRPAA